MHEIIQKNGSDADKRTPRMLFISSWDHQSKEIPRNLHRHEEIVEISYVSSGHGICELNGTFFPITAGDLVICNSRVLHDEFIDSSNMKLFAVAATGIRIEGLRENSLIPDHMSPIFKLGERSEEFQTMVNLLFLQANSDSYRKTEICQRLFQAFYLMTLDVIDQTKSPESIPDTPAALISRMRSYIDQHFADDFSVAQMAKEFDISTSYLSRVFRQGIGCSASAYLTRRRLGEAQTLLLNTTIPVSEIAKKVGYPNQSYFTKIFKKNFGISPLRYRKISREQLINL